MALLVGSHLVGSHFATDLVNGKEYKTALSAGLKNVFRLASEIGLQQLTVPLFGDMNALHSSTSSDEKRSLLNLLGAGVQTSLQHKSGNQSVSCLYTDSILC